MQFVRKSILLSLALVCATQTAYPAKLALRKPHIENGRYYYSEQDTYNHMYKALAFISNKMAGAILSMPHKIVKQVVSLFVDADTQRPTHIPLKMMVKDPIQTLPYASPKQPTITWVGHASFLIQIDGFNIITDPIFGDVKAGPFHITSRAWKPGVTLEDLPPIDAVVVSHNHADHADKASLLAIRQKYPRALVLVPEGNASLLEGWGLAAHSVIEKTWWQTHTLRKNNKKLTLTFLPAKHWSIYVNPFGYRKSLWGSWMISSENKNIYFAGDTAHEDHFKQIAQEFPQIDIALMPIGPTSEHADKKHPSHIDAPEAVDAFIELNAQCFIPMHWGTFFHSPKTFEYPINHLFDSWESKKATPLKGKTLLLARCGQPYSIQTYAAIH